jgi:hypothetical protein
MRKTWLVPTLALLVAAFAAASSAQPADQPTPRATDDRRYDDHDRTGFGWIGLVGLVGLLGLRGRATDRTRETYPGTQHTTPAR